MRVPLSRRNPQNQFQLAGTHQMGKPRAGGCTQHAGRYHHRQRIMHIAKRKGWQVRYRPAADHKADRGGHRDDYLRQAEVATARCMSRPAAPKSGTDNVPPPIPMSADKKPVMPASSFCKRDESVGPVPPSRFAPRNMRAPRTNASVAKINFNPSGTIRRAKSAPNKAPSPKTCPNFSRFQYRQPRASNDCAPTAHL
ncbi:MAG: hypothetical protein CM15mP21_1460 [Hyphomicrobiales bacterium]|nr:MAG: hypothetical protein CM15mP21_1460 [Hyphomicrobiales bacterium]